LSDSPRGSMHPTPTSEVKDSSDIEIVYQPGLQKGEKPLLEYLYTTEMISWVTLCSLEIALTVKMCRIF